MRPPPTLPAAVESAYALWLWLDARVTDFPTHARHTLGRHALDAAWSLLDALTEATYAPRASPARDAALRRANHQLAMLRLALRGARERRHLSVDQHEHALRLGAALGPQIAGWIRQTGAPR